MQDFSKVEPMPEGEPDDGFWSQTKVLEHIRGFARSRRVSPYAVLGCVLRRAIGCVEAHVVLPPTVGDAVSANLYTASTGVSGQGKGAADAAGFAAVNFADPDQPGESPDAERPNIGSGEGLARLFKGYGDKKGLARAHLIVPEVKTMEALVGRQGSTLTGELLKGYVGEPLGFSNAQKDTTTAIGAHQYRLCLGVGVQPENAGFFLSREKDGFPQRFLWLPTNDPHAPEERPADVGPMTVVLPHFPSDSESSRFIVDIPTSAREEIDAHRRRVLIGDSGVDPLDGHLMLTRLKVAFALAILAGRREVTDDDWKIAADLIDVSTRVRADMRRAVDDAHRRRNAGRAYDRAEQEAIIAERLSDESQRRVVRAITGKLKRVRRATRRELMMACHSSIRREFETVFDLFVEKRFIAVCEGGEGHGARYEFGPEYLG